MGPKARRKAEPPTIDLEKLRSEFFKKGGVGVRYPPGMNHLDPRLKDYIEGARLAHIKEEGDT